ncbi:MAG: transglutaminase-like domain-containing protein [Planctomycetaceae bacterium]|jgi:transglutaminase-like putative cysteine protease|nr:transglutaminase-like domain-containing protein [Planctomycetaceae bacterium]
MGTKILLGDFQHCAVYCVVYGALFAGAAAFAQFNFKTEPADGESLSGGPKRGKSLSQIWRAGIIIQPGPALNNVTLTLPVPMDWYEQKVININEEKTDAEIAAKIEYNVINNGAKEMTLRLGDVQADKEVQIILAFELQNSELLPPDNTGDYIIPKKLSKEVQPYLRESPCIESDNPRFTKMYHDITKDRKNTWDKVEALYSFVQNNVKYDDDGWKRPANGALAITKMPKGQWTGDCKDMSCLFVALCRAGKIPARIVRVPEHCYPEFYLELVQDTKKPKSSINNSQSEKEKKPAGFWFPCQVSGTYAFGGIPERRVILQKGDSFPDADNPKMKTLWLKECFQGSVSAGSPGPKFKWIHETAAAGSSER